MTVERTFDPTILNRVMNDPEVRPYLGNGEVPLDVSAVVQNIDNFALVNPFGGFLFVKYAPGTYEVHTQFLPEYRGRLAYEAAQDGARFMFLETDCVEILTRCPDCNRPASVLTRLMGFRKIFRRETCWPTPNGESCGVDYYVLTFDDWKAKDPIVLDSGRRFHAELEAQGCHPNHPEDEAHDRAAGAAYEMFLRGNPHKPVVLYNRWAKLAGYQPIGLLSNSPLVVDIGDAVLGIGKTRDSLEFLLCRSGPSLAQPDQLAAR